MPPFYLTRVKAPISGRERLRPPGGFLDRPQNVTQGVAHCLMQTPFGETCGDRIQENHDSIGIGRDHSVSDAGQGDLKPFSLRLLGLKRPPHGPAEERDDQPDGEESDSDLGLGLEDIRVRTRNQE